MFQDWGFWSKICCWCRDNTPVLSPVRDAEYDGGNKSSPLLVKEEDETPDSSEAKLQQGMGRTMRIVTNLAGVTVLITVTSLIIVFR